MDGWILEAMTSAEYNQPYPVPMEYLCDDLNELDHSLLNELAERVSSPFRLARNYGLESLESWHLTTRDTINGLACYLTKVPMAAQ